MSRPQGCVAIKKGDQRRAERRVAGKVGAIGSKPGQDRVTAAGESWACIIAKFTPRRRSLGLTQADLFSLFCRPPLVKQRRTCYYVDSYLRPLDKDYSPFLLKKSVKYRIQTGPTRRDKAPLASATPPATRALAINVPVPSASPSSQAAPRAVLKGTSALDSDALAAPSRAMAIM